MSLPRRMPHRLSPLALAGRALCVSALLAGISPLASAATDPDTAATIRELRARLDALEAQLKAEQATHAAPPDASIATTPAAAAPTAAKPGELKVGDTKITVGGYVKADAMYSRFSDGEVAQGTARDFYVPGSIPVSTATSSARGFTDFLAKETRLFVKSDTAVGGHTLGTHVEFDFISGQISQATAGSGNENITNAYNPALRRAFVTYDHWLIGQEWTTFQNLATLPETLDFVAFPANGTVFVRQPQLRYTAGNWQFALENPQTTVLSAGVVEGSNDNVLPDLVARYNLKTKGGSEFSLAGLARQLKIENPAAGAAAAINDTASGYGLSFSGKLPFGEDDVKFMVTSGKGVGRYLALGTSADAVLAAGQLHAIQETNGFVAYRHVWNPQWRSTLTAGYLAINNDTTRTGTAVTKEAQSYSANLLYSPVPKLTFGAEYRHATREIETGAKGALDRLQFSTKYLF
jgi:DcaP outer membrane protein